LWCACCLPLAFGAWTTGPVLIRPAMLGCTVFLDLLELPRDVRPKCSSCETYGRVCLYRTEPDESRPAALRRRYAQQEGQIQELRESYENLQQLIEALRSGNDATANTIIWHIRRGTDIASLAQHIRAGSLLLQLHDSPAPTQGHVISPNDGQQPAATSEAEAQQSMARLGLHIQSPYEELFNLLQTMDESRASVALRRIREGYSVSDILRIARQAKLSLVPNTERRYEFPHSTGFPQFIRTADNAHLEEIVEEPESSSQECMLDTSARAAGVIQTQPYSTPPHAS
jgi:hypothetical protein